MRWDSAAIIYGSLIIRIGMTVQQSDRAVQLLDRMVQLLLDRVEFKELNIKSLPCAMM